MANECQIFEMREPRSRNAPVRPVPFLTKQTLSTTNVSAAFNRSTVIITVVSTIPGTLEFSRLSSGAYVDPDGAGNTFPIFAEAMYDFDVPAGTKVRFV